MDGGWTPLFSEQCSPVRIDNVAPRPSLFSLFKEMEVNMTIYPRMLIPTNLNYKPVQRMKSADPWVNFSTFQDRFTYLPFPKRARDKPSENTALYTINNQTLKKVTAMRRLAMRTMRNFFGLLALF